jgi:hypothetical protein
MTDAFVVLRGGVPGSTLESRRNTYAGFGKPKYGFFGGEERSPDSHVLVEFTSRMNRVDFRKIDPVTKEPESGYYTIGAGRLFWLIPCTVRAGKYCFTDADGNLHGVWVAEVCDLRNLTVPVTFDDGMTVAVSALQLSPWEDGVR